MPDREKTLIMALALEAEKQCRRDDPHALRRTLIDLRLHVGNLDDADAIDLLGSCQVPLLRELWTLPANHMMMGTNDLATLWDDVQISVDRRLRAARRAQQQTDAQPRAQQNPPAA